jgi:hypothetical protein
MIETPDQLFEIGTEVETTDEYKQQMEKWNQIIDKSWPLYYKGKVTRNQIVKDTKENSSEIIGVWICVTMDNDPDKMVNQIYLRKID